MIALAIVAGNTITVLIVQLFGNRRRLPDFRDFSGGSRRPRRGFG
ncbi:MAG: hypothetical protein OXS33_07190 [bacterium]|nr:hypothetical protein [bacterium]